MTNIANQFSRPLTRRLIDVLHVRMDYGDTMNVLKIITLLTVAIIAGCTTALASRVITNTTAPKKFMKAEQKAKVAAL